MNFYIFVKEPYRARQLLSVTSAPEILKQEEHQESRTYLMIPRSL